KDPFYHRETRELFRKFFGPPDQKSSYMKVYILSPVYLRFGGSVCRCLTKWMEAPNMEDPNDDSYWVIQQPLTEEPPIPVPNGMCKTCVTLCDEKFHFETIKGSKDKPIHVKFWKFGDPRFNDENNPLYSPTSCPQNSWNETLTKESYREFYHYCRSTYASEDDVCPGCTHLSKKEEVDQGGKKKKKKAKAKPKDEKEELVKDLNAVKEKLFECARTGANMEENVEKLISQKPRLLGVVNEVRRKLQLEELHKQQMLEVQKKEAQAKAKRDAENHTAEYLVADPDRPGTLMIRRRCDFKSEEEFLERTQFKIPDGYDSSNPEALTLKKNPDGTLSLDFKKNLELVTAFQVVKVLDRTQGSIVVNITPASPKNEKVGAGERQLERRGKLDMNTLNEFILTPQYLKTRIPGLPERFEWWEGNGFVYAVIDYREEELDQKECTNFTLKVSGFEEILIKRTIIILLEYIARRKSESCPGWVMCMEDVAACLMPERLVDVEDLKVSIIQGCRFEIRLMPLEKMSLAKHYPDLNTSVELMGLLQGFAKVCLENNGFREKLRELIDVVADREVFTKDLPVIDVQKLKEKYNGKEPTRSDILWEQAVADPEKFEFFTLVEKECEEDFILLGMRIVSIPQYLDVKNPAMKICPMCKLVNKCQCKGPREVDQKTMDVFNKMGLFDRLMILDAKGLENMIYYEDEIGLDELDLHSLNRTQERTGLTGPDKKKTPLFTEDDEDSWREQVKVVQPNYTVKFGEYMTLDRYSQLYKTNGARYFGEHLETSEQQTLKELDSEMDEYKNKFGQISSNKLTVASDNQNQNKEANVAWTESTSPQSAFKKVHSVTVGLKEASAFLTDNTMFIVDRLAEPLREIDHNELVRKVRNSKDPGTSLNKKFKNQEYTVSSLPILMFEDSPKPEHVWADIGVIGTKSFLFTHRACPGPTCDAHRPRGTRARRIEENPDCEFCTRRVRTEKIIHQLLRHGLDPDLARHMSVSMMEAEERDMDRFSRLNRNNKGNKKRGKRSNSPPTPAPSDTKCPSPPSKEDLMKFQELLADLHRLRVDEAKKKRMEEIALERAQRKALEAAAMDEGTVFLRESFVNGQLVVEKMDMKAELGLYDDDRIDEKEETGKAVENGKGRQEEVDKNGKILPGEKKKKRKKAAQKGIIVGDSPSFKQCGKCGKMEQKKKQFQKCKKCVDEGVMEVRYYCSKECQVEDWMLRHKVEHSDGLLG
ncbi:hypothetical protein DPMN_118183, partial [Dreissena polymorpha]